MNLGILHIVNQIKPASCTAKATSLPINTTTSATMPLTPGYTKKLDQLLAFYDDLYHGIGKMKEVKVKLHIDETVKPVAQKRIEECHSI